MNDLAMGISSNFIIFFWEAFENQAKYMEFKLKQMILIDLSSYLNILNLRTIV